MHTLDQIMTVSKYQKKLKHYHLTNEVDFDLPIPPAGADTCVPITFTGGKLWRSFVLADFLLADAIKEAAN